MKKLLLFIFLSQYSILNTQYSFAQYCTPVTKCSNCLGFGITKVVFNTINNSSANSNAGYQNFSSIQTTVTVGQNYNLIIANTSAPAEQNFRAWIDWNDDKIFDNVNEIVASKNQAFSDTAIVNIPPNALLNTPLRMRVASDYYFEVPPTPCDSLAYGQAEDYTVIVQQNNSPPLADFSVDNITTCSGNVQFTDNSANIPTQWFWDFGDGQNSSLQNPQHTYSSSGTYSVSLIASNSFGSDTIVKNNFITVNLSQQLIPISCTPQTIDTSITYGIFNVSFNTINNSTNGNTDGYKDYSCTKNTVIGEGINYNISITTGPNNPEDVHLWIDLNGDGELNDATEKVFSSFNAKTHSGTINVNSATAFYIPLRMRIISESVGNPVTPCTNPLFGQVEDYGVTILPPMGENGMDENLIFEVFPNPNDGKFNVRMGEWENGKMGKWENEKLKIEIYNLFGEKVFSEQLPTTNYQLERSGPQNDGLRFERRNPAQAGLSTNLPNGIYFLKISDGEKSYSRKIVIEK